jgi:hypothetical protein
MILERKSVYLPVNASLRWLNNIGGVYLTQVPCFLLVSRIWQISSGIGPFFPFSGGLCKFYANAGGKQQIHTFSSIQAASQSTFIN